MRAVRSDLVVEADERFGFVDLTDDVRRAVKDSGITEGCVVAFCRHTTCSLLINEWEEGALEDLRRCLEVLLPADASYAHDDLRRRRHNLEEDHERPNGRSHVAQMLLGGSSHAVPCSNGEPLFGRWQRLMLFELDEPKERRVLFHVFGE
ncbi:MAG: secondary thiamine-phosphate synthase enzyme YjbQ [Actinomycetota bacterium]